MSQQSKPPPTKDKSSPPPVDKPKNPRPPRDVNAEVNPKKAPIFIKRGK